MSSFNEPYLNDKEMEIKEKDRSRKEKYDSRKTKLKLADEIYKNIIDQIEKDNKTIWTKAEMIETVRGKAKFGLGEWSIWNKYCDMAIGKVRRRYWKTEDTSEQRMFNYIRYKQQYWLIPIDDALRSNVVYDEYVRKMRSLQKKDLELREGVYEKVLKLDEFQRAKLIKDLREAEIIKNGVS